MFVNSFATLAANSIFALFIVISIKIWHWRKYCTSTGSKQKLKLVYFTDEILATSSREKREFMMGSNRLSVGGGIIVLLYLVLFVVKVTLLKE